MPELKNVKIGQDIDAVQGNLADYEHIYVVGDIHGMYDRLKSVMSKFTVNENDLLVFVGDYIDRGSYSAECMNYVKDLCAAPNVVALMGNHELMMAEYIAEYGFEGIHMESALKCAFDPWLHNGGKNTVRSLHRYGKWGFNKRVLISWALTRPLIVKLDNVYISHAGFNAVKSLDYCSVDDIVWNRSEFYETYMGDDKWFVGHTPVQALPFNDSTAPVPVVHDNMTFVDTGSYFKEGRISCIEIKSGTVYHSDDDIFS